MQYLLSILLVFAVACDRSEFGSRYAGESIEPLPAPPPPQNNLNGEDEESPDSSELENNTSAPPPLLVDGSMASKVVEDVSNRHFSALGSLRRNVIFSPYTASKKLMVAAYFMDAVAQEELLGILDMSVDVTVLNESHLVLDHDLHADSAMFFETSIWLGQDAEVREKAQRLALLGHEVRSVDFADSESARQQINNYYRSLSGGTVSVALPSPLARRTEVGLVDVSFFEDIWAHSFDATRTGLASFFGFESEVKVPTMRTEGTFLVRRTPTYDAIVVPYAGGSNLTIVVPHEGEFDAVGAAIGSDFLDDVVGLSMAEFVQFSLPKIDIEVSHDERLVPGFAELYGTASDVQPWLANHQRASLRFSETMTTVSIPDDDPPLGVGSPAGPTVGTFETNRPFFFALRDGHTRLVVLQGQVSEF